MIQKLKKSNAGFTLVELIVVIAILGVLMAVLVPQYIQYVEKSRQGVDRSTLSEIFHAAEITSSSAESVTAGTVTLTFANGTLTYGGTAKIGTANFYDEVAKTCPASTCSLKSAEGKVASLVYTIDITATSVKWAVAPVIGGVTVSGQVTPA